MTSDQINELIGLLNDRVGSYAGITRNHAGQEYRSELTLARLADGEGFSLTFGAGGLDGTTHYTEESRIVRRGDGGLDLLVPADNLPGGKEGEVARHDLRREEAADHSFRGFVFGLGEILDGSIFRQEITIDLWADGDIGYRYAWGLPGETFAPRSVTRMKRR